MLLTARTDNEHSARFVSAGPLHTNQSAVATLPLTESTAAHSYSKRWTQLSPSISKMQSGCTCVPILREDKNIQLVIHALKMLLNIESYLP